MAKADDKFNPADFVSHSDADDILDGAEDLGDKPEEEEEEEEKPEPDKPAAKKPAKKAAKSVEEEEEEEEEEGGEEEEEDKEDKDDPRLRQLEKKLSRTARAREQLEAQVRQMRGELEKQQQSRSDASKAKFDKLVEELDGLYEAVEEHRAKGEAKEAAKAQKRIDEIRDGMTRSQAASLATKEAMEATEARAFNTMVRELEAIDPRFDPDHDDFDQELLDNVNELIDGYEGRGMALTDALRKACKMILREDPFAKARALKRDVPAKGKDKPEPRKTDVKKNIETAKKQPPEAPGVTKEKAAAEIDMATISEKDWDALPEAVKRRHLGYE